MAIGLGQMVGLGLLSQFMGGGKGLLGGEEEKKIQSMGEYNQRLHKQLTLQDLVVELVA